MTISALVLALEIQKTNPAVALPTATRYAGWVLEQASAHDLDPWLFDAIVYRESRWTADAIHHENNGTCSVGLGQLNGPCTPEFITRMSDPHRNVQAMGYLLGYLRDHCRRVCENLSWLRGYNASSKYLAAVRSKVEARHAENGESAVLQVPAGLHAPRVPWKAGSRTSRECWLDARASTP